MLAGVKSQNTFFLRHALIGSLSAVTVYVFWLSRPEWVSEMRLWRAFGDASTMLLLLTLAIGPVARLWKPAAKFVPWRREAGIWFALLALIHTILILNGWTQWDVMRVLGYEFVPQFDRWARLEPGFGLANVLGLVAIFWSVVLLATSSDWAVRFLGYSSWKWLHYGAHIILYLVTAHVAYFLFLHYTASFHRPVPDPNWFRYPFLAMALTIFALQMSGFFRTAFREGIAKVSSMAVD